MFRVINKIFSMILVLMLTACAAPNVGFQSARNLTQDTSKGIVWIHYQPVGLQRTMGVRIWPTEVTVDGQTVGKIYLNGHAFLALKPGYRKVGMRVNTWWPLPNLSSEDTVYQTLYIQPSRQDVLVFALDQSPFEATGIKETFRGKTYEKGTVSTSSYLVQIDRLTDKIFNSFQDLVYVER